MKTGIKRNWLLLLICLVLNIAVFAQVGIGTTSPDDSSMLDIQSTSKGVLIPRMTTTQRNLITGVEGLLVFDSTTKSFWYFNSVWVELASGSGEGDEISDADADTKIQVEKNTDEDIIRFKTAGVERVTVNNTGTTEIGDISGGNVTKIGTDGSLSYVGSATRWEDLRIPTTSLKESSVDMPTWDVFIDDTDGPGVYLHWFDDEDGSINKEEELFFTAQMPHGWKEGSNIEPHVHWTTKDDATGKNVEWGLQYVWANVGDIFPSTTNIIYTNATVGAPGLRRHSISQFPEIDGTGRTLSSMLICRIFRHSSHSNDTFNNKQAGLIEIDFHYEVDSDGSNEEYTKW